MRIILIRNLKVFLKALAPDQVIRNSQFEYMSYTHSANCV